MVSVDPFERMVKTADGRAVRYRALLATMPLNRLVAITDCVPDAIRRAAHTLVWTGGHIVGIGVERPADTDRCWVYFPEVDVPCHRVTYLSNYSPQLTPKADQLSLLAELSTSPHKPENGTTIVHRTVDGLVATGLLSPADRPLIVSRRHLQVPMTYPVPTHGREGTGDPAVAAPPRHLGHAGASGRSGTRSGTWVTRSCRGSSSWMRRWVLGVGLEQRLTYARHAVVHGLGVTPFFQL